ncbi:hypothetical protein [Streptomyces sp. NPDC048192]|uniref:hypothetical protein n=1 Tax=Streptomyces sp. NPDC048192 TaxID=3365510 RepID=UPI003723EF8A
MPVYTYLLQVLPRGGGNWANLLDPRIGTPVDGTFGIVEVPENGLLDSAKKIMKPRSKMGLRLRVSFWEGRRANENLYTSEVFRTVYDDSTVVDAETLLRNTGPSSTRPSVTVRQDCPHAPHDGSCGHEGECRFAHHGKECEAVRPVCPACLDEARPAVVADIVSRVRRNGEVVLRCSTCEQLSFRFDAELVCDVCQWLVPHVNEELEDRFAAQGGGFPPQPGSCPGCSAQMAPLRDPFDLSCPKCGRSVVLSLRSLEPGCTVSTMCPNRECGEYITIPPSIWCPVCGENLRPLDVIRKLTLEANDVRLTTRSNVREDEDTQLARRLAAAAESGMRRYSYLSDEQKNLLLNLRYLDSVALSAESPEEWIRDVAEIRAAGHEINRKGGMRAMQEMHQRVMELGMEHRDAARQIELYWDGIGDWMY